MGKDGSTLGSDDMSFGKAAHLTIVIFILAIFVFFLANATQATRDLANFYLLFAIPPLLAIIADMVLRQAKGKPELPDTITVEKESPVFGDIGRRWKAVLIAASLIGGSALFMLTAGKSTLQLVSAPTFQLVQPGAGESAFMSGTAGIIENLFFFGFLLATFYVVIKKVLGNRTGSKLVAGTLAVLLCAFAFTGYHVGVYGEAPEKLDTVFYFGLYCGGSTVLTGNLIPCHSVHFWNNFGVTFFRQTSADVFLWVVLYWLLVTAATYAYIRRSGT